MKRRNLTIFTPLRHRPFRLLWSGQIVSDLGDWLDFVGLITLVVYTWDMGPGALAAISVAVALPRILVGPFAGVWVDRWPRRAVMVGADLARAGVVLGLVVAPNLAALLVLIVLKNIFSTFFNPARQAAIRLTVPEDDLLAANSLSQLAFQMGKVVGPAIGGLIVAASSPRVVFAADAATFLASAAFLIRLPSLKPTKQAPEGEDEEAEPSFWTEFRAGITYVVRRKTLRLAIASMSAALFMIFIIDSIGVLVLKELGVGEALFGLAVGSIGLGTALGSLAVGQWGKRFHAFRIMGAGQALSGGMVAVLGFAVVLSLTGGTGFEWVLVYMIIGFAAAAIFVPYGYVLQVETKPELMGRVFATADGVETVFQLLAPPLGAFLAEVWGIGPVFAGAGVALAVIGAIVFAMRPAIGAAGAAGTAGDTPLEPTVA